MTMLKAAKKSCSAILAVLLTISSISGFAAVRKTGESAEEKMLNFGIIRESKPLAEEVTCAQYSAMLIRALGLDEAAQSYSDGDWAQGYITLAGQLRFYRSLPSAVTAHQSITVENAVVMTVAALGYDVTAQENMSEQYGVGVKIGLYKNVSASAKETLVRADAYAIISNALETDLCVSENYSSDGRYMVDKDNNLMNMLLDLADRKYQEGIVEASHAVSLTGASVKDGEVMIDGVVFAAGNSGAEKYVGSRVGFYADYEGGTDYGTISWIAPHRKNSSVFLEESAEKKVAGDGLKYTPETSDVKTETFSIADSALIMFNNRPLGRPVTDGDLKNNRVSLIDNDADDIYDVMLITQIESYVIKQCYPEQDFIAFESNAIYSRNSMSFEIGNNDYIYDFYDETGERIALENLHKGDAVSVIVSQDMRYAAVYRLAKPLNGTVTEYDAADLKIAVDEQTYSLAGTLGNVDAGTSGSFYVDLWGRIYDVREGVESYVYISGADRRKGVSQQPMLRVFTRDGGFVSYDVASSVTIDGNRLKNSDDIMAVLQTETVATISVNSKNEISRIDYAPVYGERGTRTYVENDFGFTDYDEKSLTPFACSKGQTAVFFIPKSGLEEEYFNTFPLFDDEDYLVTGYDLDDQNGKVRAITVEMDVSQPISVGFGSSSKFLAVNSVRQVYNGEESTYKLEGLCEGKNVTLSAAQIQSVFNVLSTVEKGDVVQFVLNWDGEIGLARKVMDYSVLSESFYDTADYENTKLFASVSQVRDGVMTNLRKYLVNEIICEVSGAGRVSSIVPASVEAVSGTDNKGFDNYFIYDTKKKVYRQGSIDSVISGEYGAGDPSKVFILSQSGTVKFITIISD